jgi:hypothetical protein
MPEHIDPIVEEIHRVREKLAEQHGFDIRAIVRDLRDKQARSGRQYDTLPPRRPSAGPGRAEDTA